MDSLRLLKLSNAAQFPQHDHLPMEAGFGLTEDNMAHIAASTYMENCSAAMIDWQFSFIDTTGQYLL